MKKLLRGKRRVQRHKWSLPLLATLLVLAAAGSAVALDAPGVEQPAEARSPRYAVNCMTADTPECRRLVVSTVYRVVRSYGLESEWPTIRHLISCESRWTLRAVGMAGERGLWQIHPIHDWRWQGRDWRNPVDNTEVAMEIYKEVGSWEPWSCNALPRGSTIPLAGSR